MNEDDDASYFDIKKPSEETEKVWCKINEKGELEYIDWEVAERLAGQFDAVSPEKRNEQMLMCKLAVLVRDSVRKERSHGNG